MTNIWLDTPNCVEHEATYPKSGKSVGMIFMLLVRFSALLHYNEHSAAEHVRVRLLRFGSMHTYMRP